MGASWLTTVFGVGAILVALAQLAAQIIEEGGMPHDTSTWLGFATKFIVGAGLVFAKSFNVSNSPQPAAATVVSTAAEATPNPAAAPKTP
jgi:hypothetical protein